MAKSGFSNSIVVVSGAASGIGRALALQAAAHGAAVIATDVNEKGLEETYSLGQQKGLSMEVQVLDVADKEAVFLFAERSIPQLAGRKLVLINNAGVGLFTGSFHDTALEDFEWLLNINLWGTIYMTKAFYPYFLEKNEGHIVNLSSVFGLGGFANQSAYCTSKFAVRGFTETLRMELQDTGVTITSVHPGGIKTNIVKNALPKGKVATALMHEKSVVRFERAAKTSPQKAAKLILEAVAKKKERLLIGPDAKALDWVTRFFPLRYSRLLRKQVEKTFTNPYQKAGK